MFLTDLLPLLVATAQKPVHAVLSILSQERLTHRDAERSGPFGPVVDELRKSARAAEIECA
jgi:hypothetical protein